MDLPGSDPFFTANPLHYINSSALLSLVPSSTYHFDHNVSVTDNMTSTMLPTDCDFPEIPPPELQRAFFIFVYGLVSVTAIAGNAIVCFIVASFERMRKTENFFIFNLALTDIIMACLCVPFTFVPNLLLGYYPFGWLMCKVMNYSQVVSVLVSSYTLVAIAVERYLCVVFPFRPKMRRRKAVMVMCLTWILALAVALPIAFNMELQAYPDAKRGTLWHCAERWPAAFTGNDSFDSPESKHLSYVYGMILMTLQYFIPVGILVFTYSTIVIHVWGTKTPGEALKDRDKKIKDEKMRMTRMMVVVVLLYVVSWLPLNAYNVIADQYSEAMFCYKYIHYVWFACHWLAMSHASFNPIIYFWMNSKFRAGFVYALNFLFRCRRMSDEWLIDHKLIGGYSQSTKKFSQVFNRYDSVPNSSGRSKNGMSLRRVDPNGQSTKASGNGRATYQPIILPASTPSYTEKDMNQAEADPLVVQETTQAVLTSESEYSPNESSVN